MVLCIGEILADIIEEKQEKERILKRFPGGAPFNVSCNINRLSTSSVFVGRVGNDLLGNFLLDYARKVNVNNVIQLDNERNTTLAFVTLSSDGERQFCFYRKNTADYHIEVNQLENLISKANIVNLGSLMLSEESGRLCADNIIKLCKKNNKLLSFDVNYRDDIFVDSKEAISVYNQYIKKANIIKYSEEEAMLFTNTNSIDNATSFLQNSDALVYITLGKNGSICIYKGKKYYQKSINTNQIDTTGAGDAFFAGALSCLDGSTIWDEYLINKSLMIGNICGALTTRVKGAMNLELSIKIINEKLNEYY